MITPYQLLQEALLQAQSAVTEPACRIAIAALYYAVYHAAGVAIGLETNQGNSNHAELSYRIKHKNAKIGARFEALKTLRVRAHYDLEKTLSTQDVVLARNHALALWEMLGLAKDAPAVAQPG